MSNHSRKPSAQVMARVMADYVAESDRVTPSGKFKPDFKVAERGKQRKETTPPPAHTPKHHTYGKGAISGGAPAIKIRRKAV